MKKAAHYMHPGSDLALGPLSSSRNLVTAPATALFHRDPDISVGWLFIVSVCLQLFRTRLGSPRPCCLLCRQTCAGLLSSLVKGRPMTDLSPVLLSSAWKGVQSDPQIAPSSTPPPWIVLPHLQVIFHTHTTT